MGKVHTVKQGECLSQIASKYGFANYKDVYEHADNSDFRKKRPNPHLLYPGDQIVIPKVEPKRFPRPAGKKHEFKIKKPPRKLRIQLLDEEGKPLGNTAYTIKIGSKVESKQTNGEGMVECDVPPDLNIGALQVGDRKWELAIGHLNPVEHVGKNVSGIQSRLSSLGFDPGPIDGVLGDRTCLALRDFHEHQNKKKKDPVGAPLNDDGEPIADVLSKLKDAYGC